MFGKKMINNFDIDFVVSNFQVIDLKYYLDMLKTASKDDLQQLKKEIIKHKKTNRQQPAFENVPHFSTHDAIIASINHELLKQSPFYSLYNLMLKIRKPIAKLFTGQELKDHEYFGALPTNPNHDKHFFHTEITCSLSKKTMAHIFSYLFKNLYWIAPMIITAVIAIWLAKRSGINPR